MGFGRGYGRGYGRGRGGEKSLSGYTCLKFVFFTFNVLFWLLGCAILGIGIWLHIAKGSYASVAPSFEHLSATALCVAAGAMVLVVGFFGCCGAIMENRCMLLTYFLMVVVIFLLEIVAGILAFVYREEVEKVLQRELLIGIKEKYSLSNRENDQRGLKDAWDFVQQKLSCCGVSNYTDWYQVAAWPDENWVPDSCCQFQTQNCGKKSKPSLWFTRGCFDELKYLFKKYLYIVGIVGITIGVFQVLGLTAAMALFCCLRNDEYYD